MRLKIQIDSSFFYRLVLLAELYLVFSLITFWIDIYWVSSTESVLFNLINYFVSCITLYSFLGVTNMSIIWTREGSKVVAGLITQLGQSYWGYSCTFSSGDLIFCHCIYLQCDRSEKRKLCTSYLTVLAFISVKPPP